jgi:hypothetical protein
MSEDPVRTTAEALDGIFIDVEVAPAISGDAELARRLAAVCPVDVFAAPAGGLEIVRENLDESVLCELGLEGAPVGSGPSPQALRRQRATARVIAAAPRVARADQPATGIVSERPRRQVSAPTVRSGTLT